MMVSEDELRAYIDEISVIANTCVNQAKIYARYRAIGVSFTDNVEWLQSTRPPSISFFNGLTAMLENALIMAVWKMMEFPAQELKLPGEIEARAKPLQRRKHDEIRSLPRLSFLFRTAFEGAFDNYSVRYALRQHEIVEQYNLPERDMSQYVDAMQRGRDRLLDICSRIDSLRGSENHSKLNIIRNEGFAHSSAISRTFIKSGMDEDSFDFTQSTLFNFGDEAMQLALDFESIWNQRAQPPIKELIAQGGETGASFWLDMKAGLVRDD